VSWRFAGAVLDELKSVCDLKSTKTGVEPVSTQLWYAFVALSEIKSPQSLANRNATDPCSSRAQFRAATLAARAGHARGRVGPGPSRSPSLPRRTRTPPNAANGAKLAGQGAGASTGCEPMM
jgi:hypothetical protein